MANPRRKGPAARLFWTLLCAALALTLAACPENPKAEADAEVPPEPILATGPLGRIDHPYAYSLSDLDTTGEARSYHLAEGALPSGLELSSEGEVAGTPLASGLFTAEIWGECPSERESCRLSVFLTIEVAEVILLSGYGPFEGAEENPSWLAVAPLDSTMIAGYDVRVLELPVLWEEAPWLFITEYDRLRPVLAIGSGVAMGESVIRLEGRAVNWAYGEDVGGTFKPGRRIDNASPEALYSTLPLADLLELLGDADYPVGLSEDAGTYLCNYLFFWIMHRIGLEPPHHLVLGGFVHVPGAEVVSAPEMTEAWVLMLELLATHVDALRQKGRPPERPLFEATLHHPPRYN